MIQDSRTIFLVTNNYKPYCGGVARSIDTLADALKKLGDRVYIITLDFLGNDSQPEEHVIRIPCVLRWRYKKNHMALPLFHGFYVTKIAKMLKPDIIHVHHPFLLGYSGLRTARALGIPVVFTYHTLYEHYLHYVPVFPHCLTQLVVENIVKQFCGHVDGIIVPSKTIQEQLLHQSVTTKIKIIPSAIDSIFFCAPQEKQRTIPFRLLSVSRFAKEKNIEFLLRVMKQLDWQRYRLTLVGYGFHEDYLRWYAYESLGLSSQYVEFISKPSRQALALLYQDADLFIFASTTETQGLVLAEAMASGLPVVAVDATGSRDNINHGINGFLVNSELEMAAAIISLENNSIVYEKLRSNALKAARAYAPDHVAAHVKSFYEELSNYSAFFKKT